MRTDYDNPYSDDYWENCTTEEYVELRIRTLVSWLKQYKLSNLIEKFRDRSLCIFEVWTWNWEFLKACQNLWFQNIRWIDMNPRHREKYPELDNLIDTDIIQMRRIPKDEIPYDLVYTNFVFDEDCYREQRNENTRKYMLEEIHKLLQPNGLYYWSEWQQTDKIIETIKAISPRANSIIGSINTTFIPKSK